jgi:hypothetical protein
MTDQELLDLKPSKWGWIDEFTAVLRVKDGWIYYRRDPYTHELNLTGTFVPEKQV